MKIGKGLFNVKETIKETKKFSKLKKLLTIVKYMIQDSLLKMAQRSVYT